MIPYHVIVYKMQFCLLIYILTADYKAFTPFFVDEPVLLVLVNNCIN